jgi:multiple sugar transport system ATP-binding protein
MASVTLTDVCKKFPDGTSAVDHVSMQIEHGEFLVLVGPSGCGKTTTLRLIAGLEDVTSGAIAIDGVDVTHMAPKDRDVSMVFQNYALWPHMTVRQNLAFGLKLRAGVSLPRLAWTRCFQPARYRRLREESQRIHEQVLQTATTLGIEQLLHRKPRELSGGQRQRVAVGRALVRQPKLFLFDEPLSNLDAKLRVELRRELRRLHAKLGATMIYVTHDQVEAMTLGTRIAVMDQGRVRQLAEPLAIYDRPVDQFVAGFVGSPPMNFLPGRLRRETGRLFFEAPGLRVGVDSRMQAAVEGESRDVTLGVRPEHAYVQPDLASRFGESSTVAGVVQLVEPLGDDSIVHVSLGELDVTCKMDAHQCPKAGDRVALHLPHSKLHYFDANTGQAL